MKPVKKLLSIALACAMVLTLLTGCGASEKKIGEYIKEMPSVTLESQSTNGPDSHVKLKPTSDADAALLASKLEDWLSSPENADKSPLDFLNDTSYDAYEAFTGSFADSYKLEYVGISYVKLPDSKFDSRDAWAAYQLVQNICNISVCDADDNSEGTISLKTQKIGDDTYVFAVIRTPGHAGDSGEDGGSVHL